MSRVWWTLWAVACSSERQWPGGTGVGNPGTTKIVSARGDSADVLAGSGRLLEVEVSRCDDPDSEVLPFDQELDLLDSEPLKLVGGWWCALTYRFEPPLVFEAIAREDDAEQVTLTLAVDEVGISVDPGFEVDGEAFVLELASSGWIKGDAIRAETEVDEGHPLHDALAESIGRGSGLYLDEDGDGAIDPDERDPVGGGPNHSDDDDR